MATETRATFGVDVVLIAAVARLREAVTQAVRGLTNACTSRLVVSSQALDVMERIKNSTRTQGRR